MKSAILVTVMICCAAFAQRKQGSPLEHLPAGMTLLTTFGERADISPDNRRVAFMSKSFGDAFVIDLDTHVTRCLTCNVPGTAFLRVMHLSTGDYLLIGPEHFRDIRTSRHEDNELWFLSKQPGSKPVRLGQKMSEGAALSKRTMKIGYSETHAQNPELPAGASRLVVAEVDPARPGIVNRKTVYESPDNRCTIEAQDFYDNDSKMTFSCYEPKGMASVMSIDLATGKVENMSKAPGTYNEPEGIFPDGKYTCVEADRQVQTLGGEPGFRNIDIWKLRLDGTGKDFVRLTHFNDYEGWKASNPVVAADGSFMAFQVAHTADEAGVGYGIVLMKLGTPAGSGPLPKLRVSENRRFLVTEDGRPFFYLADTAWELFHRLNREEALCYLDKRAAQGFTAVQAVALAELEGITDPNPYGDLPLVNKDPAKPAVTPGSDPSNADAYDYWDHVGYIIDQANARGLYIALLPSWGRWVNNNGKQDESLLTPANAQGYGEFLGRRFGQKAVIWILGGDRTATGFEATWRALARGIAIGVSGREDYSRVLMSFHPRGGETSSTWFHQDEWLDFNMHQTGHGLADATRSWAKIAADYERTPTKPVIDGEPLYEDHPLAFRAKEYGYSFDAHVRQRAYWDVFSGACGHTYGNHSVWQMYGPLQKPVNGPLLYWYEAIDRPGASEMIHVRRLMESRPYLSRVPDLALVRDPLDGSDRIAATRGEGYAFVYSGQGRKFTIAMGRIGAARLQAWWYNPRTGDSSDAGVYDGTGDREFACPSEGFGSDWVLVLDDTARNFGKPGTPR